MPWTADRNLLLGILALQTDFITRDALIAAMLGWSVAKHRSLKDILVDRGALEPAGHDLLRSMVDPCLTLRFGTQVASRLRSRGRGQPFIFRKSAQAVEAIIPASKELDFINPAIRLFQPSRMPPGRGFGRQARSG
jgi:hypothetical protein